MGRHKTLAVIIGMGIIFSMLASMLVSGVQTAIITSLTSTTASSDDDCKNDTKTVSDTSDATVSAADAARFRNNKDAVVAARVLLYGDYGADMKGLVFTPIMVAGLFGNWERESNITFDSMESTGKKHATNDEARAYAESGPRGLGIVQWTWCASSGKGNRACGLVDRADGLHKAWYLPEVQMQYMIDEMAAGGGYHDVYAALAKAPNEQAASDIVMKRYEIPKYPAIEGPARRQDATELLPLIKQITKADGSAGTPATTVPDTATGGTGTAGSGTDTATDSSDGCKTQTASDTDTPAGTVQPGSASPVSAAQLQEWMNQDKGSLPSGFNLNHATGDSGNAYSFSQCTWWVYIRRHQLGLPVGSYLGNGGQWADSARKLGYWVDKTARHPGDIIVFHPGLYQSSAVYGHVAIVEKINADGSITTSECGSRYNGKPFTRTFSKAQQQPFQFIHY